MVGLDLNLHASESQAQWGRERWAPRARTWEAWEHADGAYVWRDGRGDGRKMAGTGAEGARNAEAGRGHSKATRGTGPHTLSCPASGRSGAHKISKCRVQTFRECAGADSLCGTSSSSAGGGLVRPRCWWATSISATATRGGNGWWGRVAWMWKVIKDIANHSEAGTSNMGDIAPWRMKARMGADTGLAIDQQAACWHAELVGNEDDRGVVWAGTYLRAAIRVGGGHGRADAAVSGA
ncbi:hypothetical protein DFH07DRAFT_780982 [Mycena maculata]|uniref:Uncharacterized protein n=1 Tax=Mycena maculata TaxID=230809 RepID=A0AAD7I1R9_9AGAR|nr:hypothetical protein DFH07DRAFT_780982 [Mycena maculata]